MELSKLTAKGKEVFTKVIAGDLELVLTKLKFGDGDISTPEEAEVLSDLVNSKKEVGILSSSTTLNFILIDTQIDNNGLIDGFNIKEIGLFARDENGAEVLVWYINNGDKLQWLQPEASGMIVEPFHLKLTVRDIVAEVDTNYDWSVFATKEYSDMKDQEIKDNLWRHNAYQLPGGTPSSPVVYNIKEFRIPGLYYGGYVNSIIYTDKPYGCSNAIIFEVFSRNSPNANVFPTDYLTIILTDTSVTNPKQWICQTQSNASGFGDWYPIGTLASKSNIGMDVSKYIEDPGTKAVDNVYYSKSNHRIHYCKATTSEIVNNAANFVDISNVGLYKMIKAIGDRPLEYIIQPSIYGLRGDDTGTAKPGLKVPADCTRVLFKANDEYRNDTLPWTEYIYTVAELTGSRQLVMENYYQIIDGQLRYAGMVGADTQNAVVIQWLYD